MPPRPFPNGRDPEADQDLLVAADDGRRNCSSRRSSSARSRNRPRRGGPGRGGSHIRHGRSRSQRWPEGDRQGCRRRQQDERGSRPVRFPVGRKSGMKLQMESTPTRLLPMYPRPRGKGAFDIRQVRAQPWFGSEIEDSGRSRCGQPDRRSSRHRLWRRLLSLIGTSRFPMTRRLRQ